MPTTADTSSPLVVAGPPLCTALVHSSSGSYDPLHFARHYDWMSEEKSAEIDSWKAALRRGKSSDGLGGPMEEEEREQLQASIARSNQSIAATTRATNESTIMQAWKSSERRQQKETGKAPFYLKASEAKKLALAARYIELADKKGALNKFMLKKTKEVKNRDHKYMPRDGREEY
jgi:ribosomal RNA-processing protein 36